MRLKEIVLGVPIAVLLALALLFFSGALRAQPVQNVAVQPDCQIFLSATAIANSVSYDNRSKACDRWIVTYSSYTFAGPLSLSVQSSADNAGAPAAWVAFAGTIVSGINPNTALTQALTSFSGYYPWMRMSLTATGAGAGRLTATLYGYKDRPASVSIAGLVSTNLSQYGGVAVGAANALHVQPGTGAVFGVQGTAALGAVPGSPIAGAGYGSGAAPGVVAPITVCDLSASITLAAAAGDQQIVALAAGKSIRICHISVGFAGVETASLVYGTGANCVTGPAVMTGAYPNILALALDFPSPLKGANANAVCVRQVTGVGGGGVVTYALY